MKKYSRTSKAKKLEYWWAGKEVHSRVGGGNCGAHVATAPSSPPHNPVEEGLSPSFNRGVACGSAGLTSQATQRTGHGVHQLALTPTPSSLHATASALVTQRDVVWRKLPECTALG